MKPEYPINTKVKFLYNNKDKDKIGTIVGTEWDSWYNEWRYLVFIPSSSSPHSEITKEGIKFTWRCLLSQIQVQSVKNQQLLFNFMNED